jgi:hypothetical protein
MGIIVPVSFESISRSDYIMVTHNYQISHLSRSD